jgi:hypothetical protein
MRQFSIGVALIAHWSAPSEGISVTDVVTDIARMFRENAVSEFSRSLST